MEVDISAQIFKRNALDRWENEGGRVSGDRQEPIISVGSSLGRVRAESSTHTHSERELHFKIEKQAAII